MEKISHIDQLDLMLNVLKEFKDDLPLIQSLPNRIKIAYRIEIPIEDINRIIGKLKEDGYAEAPHPQHPRISFNGVLFIESGGYTAKALKDANDVLLTQMEIDRRRTLDDLLATNSTRLNVLTNRLSWATWLAFGAAIALLIWEIYSHYHTVSTPVVVKIQCEKFSQKVKP